MCLSKSNDEKLKKKREKKRRRILIAKCNNFNFDFLRCTLKLIEVENHLKIIRNFLF